MFKSELEKIFWNKLRRLFKRNRTTSVQYEKEKIPYTIVSHRNYLPDFVITFPDGHKRYIEMKGYLRPEDRTKLKLVKDQHPGIDLRIIFAKDNKLNAKSQTYYSTWARKNHIPFAINKIPSEWSNRNG